MTNHPHRARHEGPQEPQPMQTPPLACMGCIQERKLAEMNGAAEEELPPIQVAITLLSGTAVCYGHITVQQQSPLLAANGNGLPPGLRRPGG